MHAHLATVVLAGLLAVAPPMLAARAEPVVDEELVDRQIEELEAGRFVPPKLLPAVKPEPVAVNA